MELLLLLFFVVVLFAAAFFVVGAAFKLVWILLIGALVGALANWLVSFVLPAGGPRGFLATALAGISGSLLASLLVGAHGFIWNVIGAIVIVFLWKMTAAGRANA